MDTGSKKNDTWMDMNSYPSFIQLNPGDEFYLNVLYMNIPVGETYHVEPVSVVPAGSLECWVDNPAGWRKLTSVGYDHIVGSTGGTWTRYRIAPEAVASTSNGSVKVSYQSTNDLTSTEIAVAS